MWPPGTDGVFKYSGKVEKSFESLLTTGKFSLTVSGRIEAPCYDDARFIIRERLESLGLGAVVGSVKIKYCSNCKLRKRKEDGSGNSR